MIESRPTTLVLLAALGASGCSYLADTQHETLAPPTRVAVEHTIDRDIPPPLEPGDLVAVYASLVDERLRPLLEEALSASPDVVVALATVEESRALALQSRAARLPTVSGQVSASAAHQITAGLGAVDSRSLVFSLPVSYEIDLVGRYAREHRATERDVLAEEADARAAAMSVAAELADAYLDLVAIREERALLERQKETNARLLAIVDSRQRAGLASSVDVRQQQQVSLGVETRLASVDDRDAQAALRLALLLGHDPGSRFEGAGESLVVPEASTRSSIAADDLLNRPDVSAAMMRLAAADDRAEAAVRAELPQLRLTATPGYSIVHAESNRGSSTSSGFTWSVGGSLNVPIFDGLRQHSIVRQRRAEIDRRLAELDRIVRLALVEAAAALASENEARRTLTARQAELALATSLREDAEQTYVRGLVPYVNVLLAVLEEQSAERAVLEAERAVLAARVTWVRAIVPTE